MDISLPWKIAHGFLYTSERLSSFGYVISTARFCSSPMESAGHLFFSLSSCQDFNGSQPFTSQIKENKALFTRAQTNLCPDRNLYGSTLRLHGPAELDEFLNGCVQVWYLKKPGQLFERHGSIFRRDSCKHPNRATFYSDSAVMAWNQIP